MKNSFSQFSNFLYSSALVMLILNYVGIACFSILSLISFVLGVLLVNTLIEIAPIIYEKKKKQKNNSDTQNSSQTATGRGNKKSRKTNIINKSKSTQK